MPIQAVEERALFEVFPDITVSPEGAIAWGQGRTAVLISADVAKDTGWRVGDRFMLPDGGAVPADEPYLWDPARGRQVLALIAADGHVLDRASIDVR